MNKTELKVVAVNNEGERIVLNGEILAKKVCASIKTIAKMHGISYSTAKRYTAKMQEHPLFKNYIMPQSKRLTLVDCNGFYKYIQYKGK